MKLHKGSRWEGEKQNSSKGDWVGARQALEGCLEDGLQTSRTIFGSNSFKGDRNEWSFLIYSVEINFPSSMLFQQPCQKLTQCKRYVWYTKMYCYKCLLHFPYYTTTPTNNFPTLWDFRAILIPHNKPLPIPMLQSDFQFQVCIFCQHSHHPSLPQSWWVFGNPFLTMTFFGLYIFWEKAKFCCVKKSHNLSKDETIRT